MTNNQKRAIYDKKYEQTEKAKARKSKYNKKRIVGTATIRIKSETAKALKDLNLGTYQETLDKLLDNIK
jgi:hypothetical protein